MSAIFILFVAKRMHPEMARICIFFRSLLLNIRHYFFCERYEPRSHFKSRWSHCQQQQSYSGLRSPGWSNSTYMLHFCSRTYFLSSLERRSLKSNESQNIEKIPSTVLFLPLLVTVALSKFPHRKALLDAILNLLTFHGWHRWSILYPSPLLGSN